MRSRQIVHKGRGVVVVENEVSSGNSSGGGGGKAGSYKAVVVRKRAQSILNSLLVTILTSLANFWNWLASRLKEICTPTDQQSTFCATSTSSKSTTSEHPKATSTITEQAIKVKPNEINQEEEDTRNNKTNQKNINKMTIEVSSDNMAKVNPAEMDNNMEECDQGIVMKSHHHLHCSLPVLRLNSESFEEIQTFSEEENSSSSEISPMHHNEDHQDSCSDYCSGSGSPVPHDDEAFDTLTATEVVETVNKKSTEEEDLEEDEGHHNEEEEDDDTHINNTSSTSNKVQGILVHRRDSDTSDSSVNDEQEGDDVPVPQEVALKIVSQVEAMFSDDHLAKDGFLLKHVRRRSDGFVSLKLVAGLRKVKQISREFPVVLTSLKQSEILEVNSEGTKIRRKEPLTTILKSLPIKQAKKEKSQSEKENLGANNAGSSADEQQVIRSVNNKENIKNVSMRNQNQARNSISGTNVNSNSRRNSSSQYNVSGKGPVSRKSSNVSTASSTNSTNNSRNNSFSTGSGGRPHPADLFRHVINGLGTEEVVRRGRGGSLPIAMLQHRGSISGPYVSPNSSPPTAASGYLRPKSNSYCEGTTVGATASNGMSPWLMKRKASVASSRLSTGDLVISGVIRQPRGPDGTKGFQSGYRAIILEERLQASQASTCSA